MPEQHGGLWNFDRGGGLPVSAAEPEHHNVWVEQLRKQGYRTAYLGKWHVRMDFAEPHLPCIPSEPFASMYAPETIPKWGNFEETFQGKPFIQSQQLRNWGISEWTWHEWSIYLSGYYGMISQVDDAIGRVLAHLRSAKMEQTTLIIFTTDHGDAAGSHRMMDKHYVMYEEEVHVPLLSTWQGVIPEASTCQDFVSHYLDLPVSLLELLELPVPENYQGRSFHKQLTGRPFTKCFQNSTTHW